jgi:single-strand DNA-binding protein
MSFNKIIIVGNLGRDPELRYTPQGNAVCNFSMATNERRRDKAGEQQDITTWFRITVWGKQAENVSKYLAKGRRVYVEGRLHVEDWTDRDGKQRYTLEVNATDVHFLDSATDAEGIRQPNYSGASAQATDVESPSRGSARPQGGGGGPDQSSAGDIEDDEIPF